LGWIFVPSSEDATGKNKFDVVVGLRWALISGRAHESNCETVLAAADLGETGY
jgi:hypothetical protein